MILKNIYQHFKTVIHHKWLVMKGCFAIGLYWQGICHDLSKFSPTEFLVGVKFYQGDQSPNNAEREQLGYSSAWLHHKGRNKHHHEYWMDYSLEVVRGAMAPTPMPIRYILEMIMDRIAASKVYSKERYTQRNPLDYYLWGRKNSLLHKKTRAAMDFLLQFLAQYGEKELVAFIRKEILPNQQGWDDPKEWPKRIEDCCRRYAVEELEPVDE